MSAQIRTYQPILKFCSRHISSLSFSLSYSRTQLFTKECNVFCFVFSPLFSKEFQFNIFAWNSLLTIIEQKYQVSAMRVHIISILYIASHFMLFSMGISVCCAYCFFPFHSESLSPLSYLYRQTHTTPYQVYLISITPVR